MRSSAVNTGDNILASQYDNLRADAQAASFLLAHQQSTPGMTLYIEAGNYWINGSRIVFAGGNTPSFTAPSSNPRIDLVVIDNSGTVSIVQGAEAATPAVPSYPANKLVLAEIYNVVGETEILDLINLTSGQGYIQHDVRSFLNYGQNFGSFASDIVPDASNTRNLGSATSQWANVYAQQFWANGAPAASAKFGGTGADGALSITSGTTTIDLGQTATFTKNYSSISITGSGCLAFNDPHPNGTIVMVKSQGNITLTSSATPMLDASGCGATGGTGGSSGGAGVNGSGGNSAQWIADNAGHAGGGGQGAGSSGGGGGAAMTIDKISYYTATADYLYERRIKIFCGNGGGGGGSGATPGGSGSSSTGGNGGNGGGALIIECGGAWNFTTTNGISVAGQNGGNASTNGSGSFGTSGAGGGGGGSAGMCIALYNTLTANTGTVNTSPGAGGSGSDCIGWPSGNSSGGSGGGGAGGLAAGAGGAGGSSGSGGTGGNGSTGSGAGGGSGGGYTGGSHPGAGGGSAGSPNGYAIVTKNLWFV